MELNEFTKYMTSLCGGIEPSHIMDALTGEKCVEILESYRNDVGDLETDHMRELWQYWHSKKESGQFFTPPTLCKLCAELTDCGSDTVLDLCAGSGAMTIAKWIQRPDRTFICLEKDLDVIPYLLFNLSVRGMHAFVKAGDALTGEYSDIWEVSSGYAHKVDRLPKFSAPEVVSNPPYNLKWSGSPPPLSGWPKIPKGNANYAFVVQGLVGCKAAYILPSSALFDPPSAEARQFLIQAGTVEHVILLPSGIFDSTGVNTCIIVLSQNNLAVRMTDISDLEATEVRDQRGMYGGAAHENRIYHKNIKIIPDDQIEKLKAKEGVYIPITEIEEHGWNLNPNEYGINARQPVMKPHRPISDIVNDLNVVNRERGMIKLTINEPYARAIGMDVAGQYMKNEEAIVEGLAEMLNQFGYEYKPKRFFTMTKARELKFEANDREGYSHLWKFWLTQWSEHIHFLNDSESRLLAELRDAFMQEIFSEEDNEIKRTIERMVSDDRQTPEEAP